MLDFLQTWFAATVYFHASLASISLWMYLLNLVLFLLGVVFCSLLQHLFSGISVADYIECSWTTVDRKSLETAKTEIRFCSRDIWVLGNSIQYFLLKPDNEWTPVNYFGLEGRHLFNSRFGHLFLQHFSFCSNRWSVKCAVEKNSACFLMICHSTSHTNLWIRLVNQNWTAQDC